MNFMVNLVHYVHISCQLNINITGTENSNICKEKRRVDKPYIVVHGFVKNEMFSLKVLHVIFFTHIRINFKNV